MRLKEKLSLGINKVEKSLILDRKKNSRFMVFGDNWWNNNNLISEQVSGQFKIQLENMDRNYYRECWLSESEVSMRSLYEVIFSRLHVLMTLMFGLVLLISYS